MSFETLAAEAATFFEGIAAWIARHRDWLAALIAFAALVVSLLSLWSTRNFSKRQLKLQEESARLNRLQRERLEREERERAAVAAQEARESEARAKEEAEERERKRQQEEASRQQGRVWVETARGNRPDFVVKNTGTVDITNVDLEIEPAKVLTEWKHLGEVVNAKTPVPLLRPGDEVSFEVGAWKKSINRFYVKVRWDAPDGKRHWVAQNVDQR